MHGAAVAIVILLTACVACAAPPRPPLAEIDAAFAARIEPLAMRAAAAGHTELAAAIREWPLPPDDGRQFAVAVPPRLEMPAGLVAVAAPDAAAATAIWDDFVAARQRHAAETFAHVEAAAPCAATRLIHRVLRDDPEHEQARLGRPGPIGGHARAGKIREPSRPHALRQPVHAGGVVGHGERHRTRIAGGDECPRVGSGRGEQGVGRVRAGSHADHEPSVRTLV